MHNSLSIYVYSIHLKRLKFMVYKIIKLLNMFFIYQFGNKFCKFFFLSFYSFVFFKANGGGHFSLLKSPHVNKKAQTQFGLNYYKGLLRFQFSFNFLSLYNYYFAFFLHKILQIKYSVCYKFRYKQRSKLIFFNK